MPETKKKFILIDANALMHRAYHALPPLTTAKGKLVNAVYGFTSVLLKMLNEISPDYIACTFDRPEPTFRLEKFKEYKAKRVKAPQEFYDQIGDIKQIVAAFNIPIFEKPGFEADDLIGTISDKVSREQKDTEVLIVTGDLDTLQLVNGAAKVYTLKKGITDVAIYDKAQIETRYGLTPEHLADFKGLRGDPSDNIPGVPGIGEKTAAKLIQEFGTLENLYGFLEGKTDKEIKVLSDNLIKGKILESLRKHHEQAFFSRELATIRKDVPISFDLEKCRWKNFDKTQIDKLFRQYEFWSLIKRIPGFEEKKDLENKKSQSLVSSAAEKKLSYFLVDEQEKFENFISQLAKQKSFVIRVSREPVIIKNKKFLPIVFGFNSQKSNNNKMGLSENVFARSEATKQSRTFPNQHGIAALPESALRATEGVARNDKEESFSIVSIYVLTDFFDKEKIKPILEDKTIAKIGHDLKYDFKKISQMFGINLAGIGFDTMLASYLLVPGERNYSLEKIIFRELSEQIDLTSLPLERLIRESARLFKIREILAKKLSEAKMGKLFYEIEMPLVKVLAKMEMTGVKVDEIRLRNISQKIDENLKILEEEIYKLAGGKFNINSPSQLAQVLFEKLKIPVQDIKKTKTFYSTAASELEKLKGKHRIIDSIFDYRELAKLKSTYIDVILKLLDKKTERIYTNFNQTITATGRLSSSDPNLQNIPVGTQWASELRRAFVAEKGYKLISVDYSQLELRIIAALAHDKTMLDIFKKGGDIHTATAALIYKVEPKNVTSAMRNSAKALNFGIIYGMSVYGFAQSAGISEDEARIFIDDYMAKFSGVARYVQESIELARERGYAETIFGRRRYLPDLYSQNAQIKNAAERMAINMPIQGTAADLMKLAMLKIDKFLSSYDARLILQIHDELLVEAGQDIATQIAFEIKKIMENIYHFDAPLVVDLKIGPNWGEMKGM